MAQDLTVNIKTTSDVPQAMDKAKAATVGFGRQVDDIGKKFSMAFKDIAFAFVAPLVLLNSAISAISGAIAKAKQDAKDAMAFAEKGESKYLRAGTVTSAREVAARRQDALDRANAKLAAETLAEEQGKEGGFLGIGGEKTKGVFQYLQESKGVLDFARRAGKSFFINAGINSFEKDTEMQDVLERRSQARVAETPEEKAKVASAAAAAVQKANEEAGKAKGTTFKGPEGFSNVVGIGANPVMEAMNAQLEEQRKQTALLQQIATPGGGVALDYTKSSAAPSRAALLRGGL
jgi:hypothetical protein